MCNPRTENVMWLFPGERMIVLPAQESQRLHHVMNCQQKVERVRETLDVSPLVLLKESSRRIWRGRREAGGGSQGGGGEKRVKEKEEGADGARQSAGSLAR